MNDGKATRTSEFAAGAFPEREERGRTAPSSDRIAAALRLAGYSPDRIERYLRSGHGA